MNDKCYDHIGRQYQSEAEMCRYYNIPVDTFRHRYKNGRWSLEKALTCPVKSNAHYDHMGNKFKSAKEMCQFYGVPYKTFWARMNDMGWSLEKALTEPLGNNGGNEIEDHLGNKFASIAELCNCYGITVSCFKNRIESGRTLEQALTDPYKLVRRQLTKEERAVLRGTSCKDHIGNQFSSIKAMCEYYGISKGVYYRRIKSGWPVEEALTAKVDGSKRSHVVYGPYGDKYRNIAEMCKAYNTTCSKYYKRLSLNYTQKEALETNKLPRKKYKVHRKPKEVEDHLGNRFSSLNEMCEHYGICAATFYKWKRKGLSVEEIFTKKIKMPVKDHLGNEYETLKKMCKAYGINQATYTRRVKKLGWSTKQALTLPLGSTIIEGSNGPHTEVTVGGKKYYSINQAAEAHGKKNSTVYMRINKYGWSTEEAFCRKVIKYRARPTKDHLGNKFSSTTEMCNYYGITVGCYYSRIRKGWTLKKTLLTDKIGNNGTYLGEVTDHMGNKFHSINKMLEYHHISWHKFHAWTEKGCTLEEILRKREICVTDHLGNEYSSLRKMCAHYHMDYYAFTYRTKSGWPLENALTIPCRKEIKKDCPNMSYFHLIGDPKKTITTILSCECELCKKKSGNKADTSKYRFIMTFDQMKCHEEMHKKEKDAVYKQEMV